MFGVALWTAQCRQRVARARQLRGPRLSGVLELRENYDRKTYRLMLAVNLGEAIYVLCAFEKKSTKGIKTPSRLLNLVNRRLREAGNIHRTEVHS